MDSKCKVGDVVVCIRDDNFPSGNNKKNIIRQDLKYVIMDIRTCPTCGMIEYKLSLPFDGKAMTCIACGTRFSETEIDCWWAEHWRFRKDESYRMEFRFV
jgi:hypothetical protein